jgi:hypothetical protein
MSNLIIELLATTPNRTYYEFFQGDWIFFGILIAIVWILRGDGQGFGGHE